MMNRGTGGRRGRIEMRGWRGARERLRGQGRIFAHSRPLKNTKEEAVRLALIRSGFTVTKRGWPDFFAVKGDEVLIVEVKGWDGDPSTSQDLLMTTLAKHFSVKLAQVSIDGKVRFVPWK